MPAAFRDALNKSPRRVHLDGSGQWSLLAGNECPSQASASGSYNLGTGALSLPHINIPGLGEFINVSARLDANTWRWQLLGAEPAGAGMAGIRAAVPSRRVSRGTNPSASPSLAAA
ncbi:MAG: hypothetical protein FWD77_07225 [Betaproteobacteria bacterium]|nr:hypothetical protein [Betaproteobacteria bacterium]